MEERGVERGSAWQSSLKGPERAIISQMNIGTVSEATLGNFWGTGWRVSWWAFLSLNWTPLVLYWGQWSVITHQLHQAVNRLQHKPLRWFSLTVLSVFVAWERDWPWKRAHILCCPVKSVFLLTFCAFGSYFRIQHVKGSKEHYLSGHNTTCTFLG